MNRNDLIYPSSEMAARFHKLPAPNADIAASLAAARTACDELQKYITTWPGWLFARGDVAVGGAGDESPLIITDKSLTGRGGPSFRLQPRRQRCVAAGRGSGRADAHHGEVLSSSLHRSTRQAKGKPVVIWRNPTVSFRAGSAVERPLR